MSVTSPKVWSVEAFLNWEAQQDERYELFDGIAWAMVGATRRHHLTVSNIRRTLERQIAPPCDVYSETMRLQVEDAVTYPDVFVCCTKEASLDATVMHEATLIVEVLSPSTRARDQEAKWQLYQSVSGLQAYLIVHADRRFIEHYTRERKGWHYDSTTDGECKVAGYELLVDEVYKGILE